MQAITCQGILTLPNTVESDLLALSSVLYEVIAGETPYHSKSDKEIETLYKEENFPAINEFLRGNFIMGCWKREWRSAEEVLAHSNYEVLQSLSFSSH